MSIKPSRKRTGPNHPAAYTKGGPLNQNSSEGVSKILAEDLNNEDTISIYQELNTSSMPTAEKVVYINRFSYRDTLSDEKREKVYDGIREDLKPYITHGQD